MRLYMQLIPTESDRAPRFVDLHLQEDLLEGWTLVKETGYQGSAGRISHHHFDDHESAINALMIERDKRTAKGYRTVFIQGQGYGT